MSEFLGVYFAALGRLVWAPVFAIACLLLIRNYRKTKQALSFLVHANHKKTLLKNFSQTKQLIKVCAYSVALLFIAIALLQPQWDKKENNIKQEGRDLLIALDISRSMLAQDIKPNRLEFMKLKIKALLNKLQFERVGLILFSGSAIIQCPLTVDYSTFALFLDHVDVETIASGTTAIDTALGKTIEIYKHYPNRKNKLLLMITDGEDFSFNLNTIKQQAIEEDIKVFALGAGTPQGAPIPNITSNGTSNGHMTDSQGNIALSKLNEPLLQELATTLHGHYLRATYDDSDLDLIVKQIESFEKEAFDSKKMSIYEDQYPWFLGISWVLLALEWIL
ncbi:VWA domain-containing protein [Candidatus Babeliales bacterium]|nr:VWA domain-containing protein [Candidatus Babeliales bacterium]